MGENTRIKLDFNNMLSETLGESGITADELREWAGKCTSALSAVNEKRGAGKLDFLNLPYGQDAVCNDIIEYVNAVKNDFEAFVVLGIGGSALGPICAWQALNNPYYNELPREARGGFPKFYVADNVDPERLDYLFKAVDFKTCLFNVISKSGSTSETMSQFLIIQDMLEKALGESGAKKHVVVTTDEKKGCLIEIAKNKGYKTFFVPAGVGGRFSELTPVGLLPAAFCGVDIKELLKGASVMDTACKNADILKNPAAVFAALHICAFKKGKNITVMMPYADSLKYMADWFAQLWAESLGKKFDNDGNKIYTGQTPVKALGVTDQHSQVQLYAHGPYDKVVVFLAVENYRAEITIPKNYSDVPELGFLGGITQNALIAAEQNATAYALTMENKMNMTITLPEVTANTLGQLFFLFETATAFAGELLNINAFDQPGVEEGKNATYAFFGKPGYAEKKRELDSAPKKNAAYII